MKAWYDSEGFKAFATEVDEWEVEMSKGEGGEGAEGGIKMKAPLKSFRAWRRKKLQGKRQAAKLADRERAKAEKMAAKMKAKADKSAKPKKGKAERVSICLARMVRHGKAYKGQRGSKQFLLEETEASCIDVPFIQR